jgi:hypothetical protein
VVDAAAAVVAPSPVAVGAVLLAAAWAAAPVVACASSSLQAVSCLGASVLSFQLRWPVAAPADPKPPSQHAAPLQRRCAAARTSAAHAVVPQLLGRTIPRQRCTKHHQSANTSTQKHTNTETNAPLVPAPRSSSVRCRHSWRRCQSATHACVLQPPHAGIVGYADACMGYAPAPSASPAARCKAVSTETSAAATREAQTAMTRSAIAAASPGADVGRSSHSSSTARRSTRTYADGSGCGAQNRAERGVQRVPLEHARAL